MVDTRNNLVDIHRFYINIYICVYLNVKNYRKGEDYFFDSKKLRWKKIRYRQIIIIINDFEAKSLPSFLPSSLFRARLSCNLQTNGFTRRGSKRVARYL